MNIIDFIPYGHENAVTYDFLCKATGLNKRAVRMEISKARRENIIINMQDGEGFFRPLESEEHLLLKFYRQEAHRNNEHLATIKPIQEYFYFKGINN